LNAVSGGFEDYSIFQSDSSDMILIARKRGELGKPDWGAILQGEVGNSLAQVGIHNESDLLLRQSASRAALAPYLEDTPVAANSDYYPYVDLNAGKAMFVESTASMFTSWMVASVPALEMLNKSSIRYQDVSPEQNTQRAIAVDVANWIFDKMTTTKNLDPSDSRTVVPIQFRYAADWLVESQNSCTAKSNSVRWSRFVLELMSAALPNLDSDRAVLLVEQMRDSACDLADEPAIQAWLELYRAVALRDGDSMSAIGQFLLERSLYTDRPQKSYLIDATMLGAVVAGKRRAAFVVWSKYGMNHYDAAQLPAVMKLVVSLSARFEDLRHQSPIS
jgi:spermidine synthase